MKLFLNWSSYQDAGMGDAYADIPKTGGNFAKAVAVCIHSGQCEKTGRGVMCPSYRISENAQLSTGGRVKLLKAALNGELGGNWINDPEIREAMALCVSCKGCKRECENEVDMALIKAEYLAQRFQSEGIPLRHRLFASVPLWLARFRPLLAMIIKRRNQSTMLRKLGEKTLGISAAVPLAEPAAQAYQDSEFKHTGIQDDSKEELVLLVDSFNRHFNPQAVTSAINVLNRAGYQVHTLQPDAEDADAQRPLCCGRTYFANGMIEQARDEAQRFLKALQPHFAAGRRIIGLEPSCILSLRDEYLYLDLADKAELLAKNILLFEEFIARENTAGRWQLELKPLPDDYLVHSHCHQKAVGASKAMRKVMRLIPEANSKAIESTCCGMAGYFGYEAEHVEHSRQMAEQGLFPALREQPQAKVIANGFSCQQQIINGGFARPQHIAELLDAASV